MKKANLVLLALMIVLPTVRVFPVPPQEDNPAHVEAARRALENAKNEIQHTGGGWGGHLENAQSHIDMAMKELNEAEKYAREHHLMK